MSKTIKFAVISLVMVICLGLSFWGGCVLDNGTSPGIDEELRSVEQAWEIIFRDYVEPGKLDASTLSQGAIKGMVEALNDPYTDYLDPETYQQWASSLEGTYEGIGAYVGIEDEQIIIIAPIAGSPAERGGIRAGDIILEINGESTAEISLTEAVLEIRGPKDTAVRLLILHQGETEPEEIEIVRSKIELPSVYFEMIDDIAYINITDFAERTDEELAQILQDMATETPTGIILDLRRNPGGLLQVVISIASRFLEEGAGEDAVVHVVDNQGEQTTSTVKRQEITTDLPMVVLVDGYSASGSEVLAGALQDYGRATIAGTTTYGKGSVNIMHDLEDGSGLYITTARWLTPNGRLIEGVGIEPDYEIEVEGDDAIQWAIDYLKSNE
jgi:carboxyl-terminal processing protease